ncbi:putative ribonuclease H-like domain-containing protein [Tanacetum coccineum]
MHDVPPPMTRNYMPSRPDVEIDVSKFTYGPKQTQPSESESQSSEFDTCSGLMLSIIDEMESDSEDGVHMTGNKAYLAEFQDFNGGLVAFGGSRGYITGKEFKNKDVIEFCGSKGIKREYSNARTPQQNGVAERKNRTLIEAARTMLADSFHITLFG